MLLSDKLRPIPGKPKPRSRQQTKHAKSLNPSALAATASTGAVASVVRTSPRAHKSFNSLTRSFCRSCVEADQPPECLLSTPSGPRSSRDWSRISACCKARVQQPRCLVTRTTANPSSSARHVVRSATPCKVRVASSAATSPLMAPRYLLGRFAPASCIPILPADPRRPRSSPCAMHNNSPASFATKITSLSNCNPSTAPSIS
jgi:hypothetical protein